MMICTIKYTTSVKQYTFPIKFIISLKKVVEEMGLKLRLQMMNGNDGGVCEDGSCTF